MKKSKPESITPSAAPAIESSVETRMKPRAVFKPSPELAKVIGNEPVTRPAALSKLWDYIRKANLQSPSDKRDILPDAKLKPVLGDAKVSMFKFAGILSKHLSR